MFEVPDALAPGETATGGSPLLGSPAALNLAFHYSWALSMAVQTVFAAGTKWRPALWGAASTVRPQRPEHGNPPQLRAIASTKLFLLRARAKSDHLACSVHESPVIEHAIGIRRAIG